MQKDHNHNMDMDQMPRRHDAKADPAGQNA